jgi:hypothetical protein
MTLEIKLRNHDMEEGVPKRRNYGQQGLKVREGRTI